jgi:hypothetical protein
LDPLLSFLHELGPNALGPLLGFALGLWLGHRLQLGRDRRSEYIAAAEPVREIFLTHQEDPSPRDRWPSVAQLDLLERRLPPIRRWRFRRACDRYREAEKKHQVQDSSGDLLYDDVAELKECVRDVLKFTARRRWI